MSRIFCIFVIFLAIAVNSTTPLQTIHFHGAGDYSEFDLTVSIFSNYRITAFSDFDNSTTCIGNYSLRTEDVSRVHIVTDFDSRYGENCWRNNFILKIREEEYEKLCSNQSAQVSLTPKDPRYDWVARDVTAQLMYGKCE